MKELIRGTTLGESLITGNRVLKYPEEQVVPEDKEKGDASFGENISMSRRLAMREIMATTARRSSEQTRVVGEGYVNKENGGVDVRIVDWDQSYGAVDPENPQNWSTGKKFFVTFLICLLTFAVYIGSAIYSAGEIDVMQKFGVSQVAATTGLTTEIPQIGRNPVYIGTLIIFVVLQFGVIYARNFAQLLIFRCLTGFFGSPVLAMGGASLCDMYLANKRAYAIAIWGMAAVSGPVMGPLVGGFAAEKKGWTWTIWELTWLSGATMIVLIILLPETSSANILHRRTRRLAKLSSIDNLKCEPEIESDKMTRKEKLNMALIRPFSLTFTEPILFCLNLYIALIYGLLYVCYQEPKFNEKGDIKPEIRLQPAFVGAFCIPICLFWFGWTSRESIHWIVPIIGSAFFSIGATLLFNAVLNYIGDAYPVYAASAYTPATTSCARVSVPASRSLPMPCLRIWGCRGRAPRWRFISVAFIPIPFVLYVYGERIRKSSRRARHDI
ncbi:hypothetical protein DID88_001161 [Monilinia fructigena]|uniref:Major facilitator superfamily (MFS) profile domain-containing protein n=1 Tax=Monilinia fructigena TaxID=38457 RepID=A0A395IYW2_9HELO|nr:hypothetical protein DID88_001161 [Monilinia fructigena]